MADDERDDPPLTVDSLADLQAGLHDDNTAARLRKKVRTDPDARQTIDALNRVRGDVAALSSDGSSAPEVDPAVVNRIGAALRAQHAVRARRPPPLGAARGGTDRVDRGRRCRLAGNPGADHGARVDDRAGRPPSNTSPSRARRRPFRCRTSRSWPCSTTHRISAR